MTFLPNRQKRPATALGASLAVIALSLLAPTQGTKSLTLYEVDVTCPIDGQTFAATMVASYTTTGTRLDLRPVGSLIAPYPFPVCPGNGFVIYQSEFSRDELAAIKPIVAGNEFKDLRRQHTDHYMVAYVKQRLGAKDFDIASSYLQASWEAERDHPQLVKEYRALALAKFDAARAKGDFDADDGWTAAVIGAELARLLGDFAGAEERLGGLPLQQLQPRADHGKTAMLRKAVEQIRQHAVSRNAEPQVVSDEVSQGTVGSGVR